jgi:hypothetical protein
MYCVIQNWIPATTKYSAERPSEVQTKTRDLQRILSCGAFWRGGYGKVSCCGVLLIAVSPLPPLTCFQMLMLAAFLPPSM